MFFSMSSIYVRHRKISLGPSSRSSDDIPRWRSYSITRLGFKWWTSGEKINLESVLCWTAIRRMSQLLRLFSSAARPLCRAAGARARLSAMTAGRLLTAGYRSSAASVNCLTHSLSWNPSLKHYVHTTAWLLKHRERHPCFIAVMNFSWIRSNQ